MKNMRKILRNQEGFTLIEIIAVLVILGILAAIAIPKYQNMQTAAQYNAAQGALGNAASGLSLAYAQCIVNNTIPTALSGTGGAFTGCTAASATPNVGDFTVTYNPAGAWGSVSINLVYGSPTWLTVANLPAASTTKLVILQ